MHTVNHEQTFSQEVLDALSRVVNNPASSTIVQLSLSAAALFIPDLRNALPAELIGSFVYDTIQKSASEIRSKVVPATASPVHEDLQQALRSAFVTAVEDIGGPLAFPEKWKRHPHRPAKGIHYPYDLLEKIEDGKVYTPQLADLFHWWVDQATEVFPLNPQTRLLPFTITYYWRRAMLSVNARRDSMNTPGAG
jgi:hypothetical protein